MRGRGEKSGLGTSPIKPSSEEEGSCSLNCNRANQNPRLQEGGQSVMRMLIATQQDDAIAYAGEVSDCNYSLLRCYSV